MPERPGSAGSKLEGVPTRTPVGDGGEITLGEVYRYLLAFESRTLQDHQALEAVVAAALAQMVPREVWGIEHLELESRIAIIEGAERGRRRDTSNTERAILVALVGSMATGILDLVVRLVGG